jgi:hypothetical protein
MARSGRRSEGADRNRSYDRQRRARKGHPAFTLAINDGTPPATPRHKGNLPPPRSRLQAALTLQCRLPWCCPAARHQGHEQHRRRSGAASMENCPGEPGIVKLGVRSACRSRIGCCRSADVRLLGTSWVCYCVCPEEDGSGCFFVVNGRIIRHSFAPDGSIAL